MRRPHRLASNTMELIGDPVAAHRHGARPRPAPHTNPKPAYLEQIEQLLR